MMEGGNGRLRVMVAGAAGRMGRMLVAEATAHPKCRLHSATLAPGDDRVGLDAGSLAGCGETGVLLTDDPAAAILHADVCIDFTGPKALHRHAALAAQAGTALIVGSTGLGTEEEKYLHLAARHVPVVRAANFSTGIALMKMLVKRAAAVLNEDWDIEVLEMHHRNKLDAPSGTALELGRAAARGRDGTVSAATPTLDRNGARKRGEIGYAVLRGGDVNGEHAVIFAGEGERLELSHKSGSRRIFAAGALRAALWCRGRTHGLYGMEDVLTFDAPPDR